MAGVFFAIAPQFLTLVDANFGSDGIQLPHTCQKEDPDIRVNKKLDLPTKKTGCGKILWPLTSQTCCHNG